MDEAPIKLLGRRNGQLWEFVAAYPNGDVRTHQTLEPGYAASEAHMLEHIKKSYPNLTITSLRRCDPREAKPAKGPVERHAYQQGDTYDIAMRELGLLTDRPKRESILAKLQRERLARISGQPIERFVVRKPSLIH